MPQRSAIPAIYPESVPRIQLTLPDDFLGQIDDVAARADESREEFIRRSVEEEVRRRQLALRKELEELLDGVEFDLGGKTAAELIREDRDHRDDKRFGPDGNAR